MAQMVWFQIFKKNKKPSKPITDFQPEKSLNLIVHHSDGNSEAIVVNQSYNQNQIEWFKSGSALNSLAKAEKHLG